MRATRKNIVLRTAGHALSACVLTLTVSGCTIVRRQSGDAPAGLQYAIQFQTRIDFMDQLAQPLAHAEFPTEPSKTQAKDGRSEIGVAPTPKDERAGVLPSTGVYLVQIAAYRTVERAQSTWHDFERALPLLSRDVAGIIEYAGEESGDSLYRLRAGYFPNIADARAFCLLLGLTPGNCMIVRREATRGEAFEMTAPKKSTR